MFMESVAEWDRNTQERVSVSTIVVICVDGIVVMVDLDDAVIPAFVLNILGD